MKFWGYQRPDGQRGIRNHVLILPTCACSSETCRLAAAQIPGAVTFSNQNGCAQVPGDLEITKQILAGLAANPNVFGTVLVGLGCENAQPEDMAALIREKTNKPLHVVVIQEEGGTLAATAKAVEYASSLWQQACAAPKVQLDIADLIVGTECGGSDSTSGLAANPVVGNLSDRLVALGATVILSETTEFIGAEHILARRAVSHDVATRIFEITSRYEEHIQASGENLREGNPSPGNKAGGITTLEEKSLGCIHKGGHSPITEVVDYGQRPTQKGLLIMDTPGYDVASMTGMAAGGCQLIVFTTGRGTPTGNPIVPVVKMTGNDATYQKMRDNMDFDASPILTENATAASLGEKLLDLTVQVANGRLTKAESFGFSEIAISRLCNYV